MQPIADAVFERKISGALLPLVPFSEWFEKLESSANDTSEENIKRIVRKFLWLNGTSSYLIFHFSLLSRLSTTFVVYLNRVVSHSPLMWRSGSVRQ